MNDQQLWRDKSLTITKVNPETSTRLINRSNWQAKITNRRIHAIWHIQSVNDSAKNGSKYHDLDNLIPCNQLFALQKGENEVLFGVLRVGGIPQSPLTGWLILNQGIDKLSTMLLKDLLKYAFNELGLHRLSVLIPGWDEDAIAAVEEAGFLRESQRRQAILRAGIFYDELSYGILDDEWRKFVLQEDDDEKEND